MNVVGRSEVERADCASGVGRAVGVRRAVSTQPGRHLATLVTRCYTLYSHHLKAVSNVRNVSYVSYAFTATYLQYLTSLECSSRQKYDRTGHMAWLHTDHVRVFIVSEVRQFLGPLDPGVPQHCVWEVILLDTHLSPWYYVRYDVLLRGVLIDTVCPLVDSYYISPFLAYCIYTCLEIISQLLKHWGNSANCQSQSTSHTMIHKLISVFGNDQKN